MTFPLIPEKWREPGLFSAKDFVAYLKKQGRNPKYQIPTRVVVSYSGNLVRQMAAKWSAQEFSFLGMDIALFSQGAENVAVVHGFGIGSPAAVTTMELLIALGVDEFIHLGTAGSLQSDLRHGDIVACEKAIRDEGTSRNYLPPGESVTAHRPWLDEWCARLGDQGLKPRRGTTWTTDAPYRETAKELGEFAARGVLTVEMEAAAVMALGEFHGVKSASFFVISDELKASGWEPLFHSAKMQQNRQRLFEIFVGLAPAPAAP